MDSKPHVPAVRGLRARLHAYRIYCAALAEKFEKSRHSLQKTNLAFRWDEATKQGWMVQLVLELVERHEREECARAALEA